MLSFIRNQARDVRYRKNTDIGNTGIRKVILVWLQTGNKKILVIVGFSLLRGLGKEVHFLLKDYYKIIDESMPGATIRDIRNKIVESLSEFEPDDLVIIEGGGNDLLDIGEQKILQLLLLESIVKVVNVKVKQNPLAMCIPVRRKEEGSRYGAVRRAVNRKCLEKLEKWSCDGLQLHERMDWRRVWAFDGVHMSDIGKVWTAWNVVEWAQHKETVHNEP